MQVPSELLKELTDAINAISDELQPKAKAIVDEIARQYANGKGAIVPEMVAPFRADVVQAMDVLCSGAADLVAVHASDLYDKVRVEVAADQPYRAIADPCRDSAKTEGAIRALIESVVRTGKVDAFSSACASRLDYEMRRAAAECMVGNAKRDPLRPKWARVPSGRETCSFCLMLASFGANYNEEDSISHVHANCDCRMVQVYEGMTIEGYDPDRAYAQTEQCLETIGGRDGLWRDWEKLPAAERAKAIQKHGRSESKAFDSYVNKRLSAEMATRDPEWLRTGKVPRPTFATPKVLKEIIKDRKHELRTAARITRCGIRCDFVDDSSGLPDLANRYELKTLQATSSSNTINSHLKKCTKKKAAAAVFDNCENDEMSDAELAGMISGLQSFHRGRVYIVTKEKKLVWIR